MVEPDASERAGLPGFPMDDGAHVGDANVLLFLDLGDGAGFEVKVVASKARHLKSFSYPPHVTFLLWHC